MMLILSVLIHLAHAYPPDIRGARVFSLTLNHRTSTLLAVDDVPVLTEPRWRADLDKILGRSCELLLQPKPTAARYRSDPERIVPAALSPAARRTFDRLIPPDPNAVGESSVAAALDEVAHAFPLAVAGAFDRLDRATVQDGLKRFQLNPALLVATELAEGRPVSAREVYTDVLYGAEPGAGADEETWRDYLKTTARQARTPVSWLTIDRRRTVTLADLEHTLLKMGRMLDDDRLVATHWNLRIARTLRARLHRRFFTEDPVQYGILAHLLELAVNWPAPKIPAVAYDDAAVDRIMGKLEYSGSVIAADAGMVIPGMNPGVGRTLLDALAARDVRIDLPRVGRPALRVVK